MATVSTFSGTSAGDIDSLSAVPSSTIGSISGITFPNFEGLLDTYTGAAAGYSVRRLASATTTLMRVRRSGLIGGVQNDDEADVAYDSNNVLGLDSPLSNVDAGVLSTTLGQFVGNGTNPDGLDSPADGYVATWFDQSGNANDATQAADANQPQVITAGVIEVENGKPAVEFNGTSTEISAPTVGLSVATCFIHHTNFDANARMFGQFDQFENSFLYDTVTGYWAFNNGGINLTGLSSTTSKLVYALFDNSGGELGINGATATSGTLVVIGSQMDLRIGKRLTSYWKGTASELIVYDSDESANRTGIESDINTFFSIYP